ncbi:MAG: prepilin peptidase [Oscillospiraceae bacterium]|nr:prepilin peptidase [Oscillospiraceae bacterium]
MQMIIMMAIYFILAFTIGTLIGSFLTLAIHRIPLKQDILIKRSYCPKCEHRLEFLDLIPVWSYIFLKGKCRYCGNKIRPRYLIIEVISGIVFLAIGILYAKYRIL